MGGLRRGPESGEQAFEVDRTVGVRSLRGGPESGEQAFKTDKQKRERKKALNLRFHATNPTTIQSRPRRPLMTVHTYCTRSTHYKRYPHYFFFHQEKS